MRFKRISIGDSDEYLFSLEETGIHLNGLKPIEMNNLQPVVAIFGKNGSGKSRLLNIVKQLHEKVEFKVYRLKEAELKDKKRKLAEKEAQYVHLKGVRQIDDELKILREDFEGISKIVTRQKDQLNGILDAQIHEKKAEIITINSLNNKIETLNKYPDTETLDMAAKQVEANEYFSDINKNLMPYLTHRCEEMALNEHPKGKETANSNYIEEYNSIKQIIKSLLGFELGYKYEHKKNIIVTPTFNGREVKIDELSEGQQILLKYAFIINQQLFKSGKFKDVTSIADSIIIIDEPETFLHPAMQIEIVQKLKDLIKDKGQLFIATHSLALLSALEDTEIWIMQDGEIKSPSIQNIGNAFRELLGDDDKLERFYSISDYSSKWAANEFAAQCLLEPQQVDYNSDDPQGKMIKDAVIGKILDFGAGKGRLKHFFDENNLLQNGNYEYYAFEPDNESVKELKNLDLQDRIISDLNTLKEKKAFFDRVILCNVLHEIKITHWKENLEIIFEILKPEGQLIFVEDKFIPRGEKPSNDDTYGFIILDEDAVVELFGKDNIQELDKNGLSVNHQERLLGFCIKKAEYDFADNKIREIIKKLKVRCFDTIETIRKSNKSDAKIGREYARYSQLYINCQLAIKDLN